MSMATLEFIQSSSLVTPDVLFGDFSENEVASIIYKSSLFNKNRESVCFGSFSETEVNEIINTSHSKSDYVSFDFDELDDKPISVKSFDSSSNDKQRNNGTTNKGCDIRNPVAQLDDTPIVSKTFEQPTPVSPCPRLLNEVNSKGGSCLLSYPVLSTPERTDIDDVLKILIEETVRASDKAFALGPQDSQDNFSYKQSPQTTAWSNGTDQQTWSSPGSFPNFYQNTEVSQQMWHESPQPQKTPTMWSNGNQWSSLFKNANVKEQQRPLASPQIISSTPPNQILSTMPSLPQPQILSQDIPVSVKDHELMMLGSQLQLLTIHHHKSVDIIPRGLINKSTNCFAHAPLQALIVSPLYHIIHNLDSSYTVSPVLRAMKQFFGSFNVATGVVDKMDPPFEPTCIFEMLRSILPTFNENGRQEDAEEFLGIILSNLHDEMVTAVKSSKKTVSLAQMMLPDSDGEWQQIGKKNKVQVTRNTSNNEASPVSELFGGLTRSVVSKASAKESATLQPFLSLQLDIQHEQIKHVTDALVHFTHREQIMFNDTKCYRQETLESLPPVLILHLKRFIFNDAVKSCQKLHKEINFDVNLEIENNMMSAVGTSKASERKYRLFGVVYHHGSHAAGGHYSAMVYHPYIQSWVYCDDDKIHHQDDTAVLKHIPGRSAYLLFYKREQ